MWYVCICLQTIWYIHDDFVVLNISDRGQLATTWFLLTGFCDFYHTWCIKKNKKKKTVCSVIHRPISDVKCLYFFPNTLNDPDMDNYYKRDEVVWLKALWPHFIQRKLDSIELNTVWHYLKEYSGFKSSSVNRFGIMLICHGN